MQSLARNRQVRNEKGSVLAEISVACLIVVFVALFAMDIGIAMVSYGLNDRACRDAARAAAQGASRSEATALANRIVLSFAGPGNLITAPRVLGVDYQDFGGNAPPAGQTAFVTVTTQSTARPISPLNIFGSKTVGDSFPLRKTYTFPIVKLTVAPTP